MAKTDRKVTARQKRVRRIRKKISGDSQRPRLRVFRSNKHIYAQVIDDASHTTLASVSTMDKALDSSASESKCDKAKAVGKMLAERVVSAGIKQVIFDRGGYLYHGRVKALSDGAREGGLKF